MQRVLDSKGFWSCDITLAANRKFAQQLHEEVEKFRQNLELYEDAVGDPRALLEAAESAMREEGEEIEGETAEARANLIVARAMAARNLTREEEEREQAKLVLQDAEEAALSSEKQVTNLSMLGVIFVALALLVLTIQMVKKKGDAPEEFE